MAASVLIGAVVLLSSCEGDRPAPPRTEPEIPDKVELFGDAGLVPTRDGEHARLELAKSGEIALALRTFPYIEESRVNVELPQKTSDDLNVLVAARISDGAVEESFARASIEQVIGGVLGPVPEDAVAVVLSRTPAPEPAPDIEVSVMLALGLIGFGVSAGVSAERLWQRRRTRRDPRR